MKRLLVILSLVAVGFGTVDCGKKPVNLTPAGNAAYVGDEFIRALSDFQDGVEVGYHAGWLSKQGTFAIAEGISTALVSVHAAPTGAKGIVLAALDDITAKLKLMPDFAKYVPYLTSVRVVVQGLK